MENISNKVHIGELIAVSNFFKLNTYRMITLLENGVMEIFEKKEDFFNHYREEERNDELDWCELNNGKIFTKPKHVEETE
ncbi:hypothetical protein EJF36_08060 [Bacillus sp. HMF5848]|uniref:hypothetical protein n=1 Tax=Bacillus sp. HMF5848 TaxID=2495421 RepID=UPI000F7A1A5B|nr:hypothetical protein [Bacillus sp. HMF5848]RSK26819.1 hypothetical protein EJF36_08060 [Bacillus sp. HMF5848]